MTLVQIYRQSNSSLDQLRGNTLLTSPELVQARKHQYLLNSGLKESIICMAADLNQLSCKKNGFVPESKRFGSKQSFQKIEHNASYLTSSKNKPSHTNDDYNHVIQVDKTDVYGEFNLVLPKRLHQIRKRVLIWNELATIWKSSQNRIKGYILNGINGGFSVAIAGRIAFLPKSLKLKSKINRNNWRTFSILNMNSKLQNIVVKEVYEIKPIKQPIFLKSSNKK